VKIVPDVTSEVSTDEELFDGSIKNIKKLQLGWIYIFICVK